MENIDQFIFGGFVNEILNNIETHPILGNYDDEKYIIWDNLSAHNIPYVTNIIEEKGTANTFNSVDRPPYTPRIAPVEFIFFELATELSRRCKRD